MGLDTSHDAWSGAYSAFNRWRDTLTKTAGLPMVNDGATRKMVDADWAAINEENIMGEWGDKRPTLSDGTHDPLLFLMCHCDCDGLLHPDHCAVIADRLEALLPQLEGLDLGGHVGIVATKTRTFIAGLRSAVEANEDVTFG